MSESKGKSIYRSTQRIKNRKSLVRCSLAKQMSQQETLALASMARDDPHASSTPSSTAPASSTAAAMRGKVGSEFET